MPIVRLDKVSLSYGLKPLLDHVSLQLRRGERVCLLGRNGEGKSSLLQLIGKIRLPDSGEVWVRPGARIASLAQEVSGSSDATVRSVVLGGKILVPTPGGTVTVMVPRGSNTGKVLRLKGRGVPAGANQRGDEYLTLQIMLPERRDPDMEAFVTNWPAGKTYSPRRGMGV